MTVRSDAGRVDTRLTGWWLFLAWLAWAVVTLLTLALLVYLVPANYRLTRIEWAVEVARPAAEVFVSYNTFVGILVALETLTAAVALGMGLLVAALRPADRMGLLTSAILLTMSPFMLSGNIDVWRFPAWLGLPAVLLPVYAALFVVGLVLFIYLFPDGRLAFPWVRWLAAPVVAAVVLYVLRAPLGISDLWISEAGWGILMVALFTLWLSGLATQAYRYRRLASAARQQIKWVLLGLSAPLTGFSAMFIGQFLIADPAWFQFVGGPLQIIIFALIPVTIGISMLRYHLWDVDVVIRRTLIYGALTGTLLAAYLFSILILQYLFRALTRQESSLAIVISTLAIAALSAPLRRRIQDAIDRRFFRKKYDAQRVLAQFAQTARDETDLDALTGELARVVQETLQPERVSVWLNKERK
ncbi:MAG: hypothetical protein WAV60_14810 [Anaerolineae bacterium]